MRKEVLKILQAIWSECKRNSFLHFLSFFITLFFGIWFFFPSSCTQGGKRDVLSPSHKWVARYYQETCGYLVPAEYVIDYVALVSSKPGFFAPKDGWKILSLDPSAQMPDNAFIKTNWKDDRNLEITTNACGKVCYRTENKKPEKSAQSCQYACNVTSPVEGINITLIRKE